PANYNSLRSIAIPQSQSPLRLKDAVAVGVAPRAGVDAFGNAHWMRGTPGEEPPPRAPGGQPPGIRVNRVRLDAAQRQAPGLTSTPHVAPLHKEPDTMSLPLTASPTAPPG